MTIKELEKAIKGYDKAYRDGDPLITDMEYDLLLDQLREKDPGNELLKKAVIEDIDSSNPRMEDLPIPMYSLEKVKTIEDLKKTISSWGLRGDDKIIITPKYDGISLCVDENEQKVWTRGDGIQGQRSDSHYKAMRNGKVIMGRSHFGHTFGEAIFRTTSFLKLKGDYKSARNCVAGLFNSPEVNARILDGVHYVRYGTSRTDLDKMTQLDEMYKFFAGVTDYMVVPAIYFNNDENVLKGTLNTVFERLTGDYKCDGLVIEVNKAETRNRLGRLPNNNPRYAVAYKDPDWSERSETVVKGIEWNVSKDGKVKPVILIEPVDLCGATVQRASAYNAKYVCDNRICKDAKIIIARSGDVIPKHLKTLSYESTSFQTMCDEMMICPSCGEPVKWDSTQTELVCINPNCDQKNVSELVYFFSTLGTEECREPTLRKLFNAGLMTPHDILKSTPEELMEIEGIGASLSKKLCSQFLSYKTKGLPLARLMAASNVFGGVLSEKTCQMIFDNLSEEDLQKFLDCEPIKKEHLLNIDGVGEVVAEAFIRGCNLYSTLPDLGVPFSYINQPKKKAAENQMNVCFTGFRDKEWEERLINAGHKIASGVTSKTTYLVVKDQSSASSKKVKANSLQIPIYTKEEWETFMETNDI